MSILYVLIGSCKKEINDSSKEKLDPDHLKEIHSYQNGNKLSTINFAEFKTKANLKSLGALKDIFLSPTAGKGKLMSVNIPETYNGFAIQTDSIKVLNTNGHTSYIFPVKLSSPRAVTFQNLTIDESETGTLVFVNTYTPTQKWIADWKLGKAGKFEGDISVSYLNSGANNPLNNISNVSSGGKIANANIPNKVALVDANGCSTTTYTFELAYNCGSGNHGPGDTRCILTGDAAAGIAIISFDVTTCIGGAGVGGGGGNTTTNPPNNYDPCAGGGGTPSVSYNGAKGAKLMVHQNPDCGGTTLPPVLDPVDSPAPPKEVNNFILDPKFQAKYPKFTALLKDLKSFVKNDKKVMDALVKWSGFDKDQIMEKIEFEKGPEIVVKELTDKYGYFNASENPNIINIDASWVRGLESANLLSTNQSTAFLLGVTVLHEFVHQARASNEMDDTHYEFGDGFEITAFGLVIGKDNAGKYSYRFFKE